VYEGENMALAIRRALVDDAALLHDLAAATFGLACPPGTRPEAIAAFISANLSMESFQEYLADSSRDLFIALVDGSPAGYTMLVNAEPQDPDVAASITARPTAELSKVYVLEAHHGAGVAASLVQTTIDAARERGAAGVWLGVNQENAKANRFYEKQGFVLAGSKKFLVGERWEDDFVRELVVDK
jgi:ribosomal protein S18 acetylase RimI-like enzyme